MPVDVPVFISIILGVSSIGGLIVTVADEKYGYSCLWLLVTLISIAGFSWAGLADYNRKTTTVTAEVYTVENIQCAVYKNKVYNITASTKEIIPQHGYVEFYIRKPQYSYGLWFEEELIKIEPVDQPAC